MMKTHIFIKRIIYLFCAILGASQGIHAQNDPVKKYLDAANDHAVIYSGEMGATYTPILYTNTPYYVSSDYVKGDIWYRGCKYPDQLMRLDLYCNQLILLSPKSRRGMIVNPENLNKFHFYNKDFIWHTPSKESGLRTGYYALLFGGENLSLLYRENRLIVKPSDKVEAHFQEEIRYYLLYQGKYSTIKSKRAFAKLFPAYKKEIKAFMKDKKLDFGNDWENSCIAVTAYCEKLLYGK